MVLIPYANDVWRAVHRRKRIWDETLGQLHCLKMVHSIDLAAVV